MVEPDLEKPLTNIKSETIFLDPFPALGHINAFVDLGEWLKRNGFNPIYLIQSDYVHGVSQRGVEYVVGPPFLNFNGRQGKKEKGLLRYLLDNMFGERRRTADIHREEFETFYDKTIRDKKPSMVLLDDHYAVKALYYQKAGVKVILVSTMLLPLRHLQCPPFQSTFVPDGSLLSEVYINFLWTKIRLRRWWGRLTENLLTGGQTDLKILMDTYGLGEYVLDRDRAFGLGFKNLPTIATYPKTFDLVDMQQEGRGYYFGLLPSCPKQEIDDYRLAGILKSAIRSGEVLVYCSLGTVTVEYTSFCQRFFNRLLKGATSHPRLRIILNVGKYMDISKLYALPGNVSVFNYVPQAQLLKRVDVMINHGGLNTIKECIAEEVPMLVYPLSPHWDQPGGGARVVAKGIGLRGNIRKDSQKEIYRKINLLIADLPKYRSAIATFREETEKQSQAGEVALLSRLESEIRD